MLHKTQGLVLRTTKYAETSVIAKIFTRDLGLRSYMVKGVRSASGRTKQNLLQPLTHLDMVVYNNPNKQLQYIKEMQPAAHYNSIACDSVKTTLLFFMDEVLYKSLKDEESNVALFDYVVDELRSLNGDAAEKDAAPAETPLATLPISFLIRTARHLGIEPMDNYSSREPLFNLKEGRFQAPPSKMAVMTNPDNLYCLDIPSSSSMHYFLHTAHRPAETATAATGMDQRPSRAQRTSTLNNLLEYYHVHLSDFKNFKSHEVLHGVLR